jgi:hypothetical protein
MSMPIPPDPRLPVRERPPTPKYRIESAPNGLPSEPYYVQPEAPESLPFPKRKAEPKPGNTITDSLKGFITAEEDYGPSEPYTTYEGRRYMAEMKHDNTSTWVQANFIHWWVRGADAPPLATTGALGNPATSVLLDGSLGPKEFSGIQATIGGWLDAERMQFLEVGGFWVGRSHRQYNFASDAGGSPLFGQPLIINGAEAFLATAQPGLYSGSMQVNTAMDFHGLELNLGRNICRVCGWSADYLVGFRYLYLNDTFTMDQNITTLAPNVLPFNNVLQPAGANFLISDSFDMTNRFYGGTIGGRVNWTHCRFDIGATVKVSFGATRSTAVIDGFTTLAGAGTAQGGSLAQPSNSGEFSNTDFSVVSELTATAGYQLTPGLRILVGYTFLDWTRVQRAASQIDRNIDLSQVPTNAPMVPGSIGTAPRYPGSRTDFWAQGLNVGLELKW